MAVRERVAIDPQGALQEVQRQVALAAEERRLATRHRWRSKRAWKTAQEFKEALEAIGVTVIFEPPTPSPRSQGDPSDHSSRSTSSE